MGDCDVCIGVEVDGYCEFSETKIRKARKPAKCCECQQPIQIGEQYEVTTMIYEGEFCKYRTCLLCVEIRRVFTCGEGFYYESLWEEMEEYAFERLTTASKCFRELSPEAKAFVLERWRRWKGLQ
ncbi:MAG TPA: hypothetical protein VKQ11_00680 [Candidatus Sulfotelmatobacter sp.]|nr:hypothetical protein [Candidatus Sulfotelmatobacter sp.]